MSAKQVLEIENRLLRELVDTALGARKAYRVVSLETGDILDLETAQGVMDHLFAAGGFAANRRYAVFKERRRWPLPAGGEVGALAQQLEAF